MKVLFANTNDSSGGAARAAMRIMRGVQQSGVEAQMFVKDKYSKSPDVIPLSAYAPSSNWLSDIFKWVIQKFKNRYHMFKWHPYKRTRQNVFMSDLRHTDIHGALQRLDYDIVHLHWINNRFLDIRKLAKIHKPIVWTLHDSWPFCGVCHLPMDCKRYERHCGACPMLGSHNEKDLAYEIFEKKLEVYKDLELHIVTPSRWLAECVRKSVLLGKFPIMVIPNCINTELYQPLNKQDACRLLGLEQDKKYILFGAMQATKDQNKGFDLLLKSLNLLQDRNVELIVYGTNENLNIYDIPMPVHSLGYINDDKQMSLIYNAADVSIVPSRSENLSNTIMESLSCGTPVVAFNIGGNSDMIDHQQNGYLANELDCEDMAHGIQWCLEHKEENTLWENAREKVMANYTIQIVSEQYNQLYQSLLKKS